MSRGGTETHKHSLTPWGGRMRRCLKRPKLDKRWLNCYAVRHKNYLILFICTKAVRHIRLKSQELYDHTPEVRKMSSSLLCCNRWLTQAPLPS